MVKGIGKSTVKKKWKRTWGLKDQGTERKGKLVILSEGSLGSWLDNDDVGKNYNIKV